MRGGENGPLERGFTLVELLVVILIIAVLAAIAVPIFLRQREKSYVTHVTSSLKNAATVLEAHSVEHNGTFPDVHGANSTLNNPAYQVLAEAGYKKPPSVEITIATADSDTKYCITATHSRLPAGDEWKVATYNSSSGAPSPSDSDDCP